MRKPGLTGSLLFFAALLLPSQDLLAEAVKESQTEVVQKIESAYDKLQDIEAGFTQKILFKDFATPFISKGAVYLKPGKMRWDYREPTHQQIFVDGEKVLYYVPEHQQVVKSNLALEADSHVPIHLLSGTTRLSKDFDIALQEEEKEMRRLELVPKDPNMKTVKIEIEVSAPSYLIQKVTLHESNGNRSVFDFSDMRVNRGLKDSVFTFAIPKGVEVVEQPPIP
jgi:outer membrane lipoprotein carrier protein